MDACSLDSSGSASNNECYEYTVTVLNHFSNLFHPDVILMEEPSNVWASRWGQDAHVADFQSLVGKFQSAKIETFKLDTSSISDVKALCHDEEDEYDDWPQPPSMTIRCAMNLGPARNLCAFSNLRKFVAAQNAFFTIDKDLIVCELPASIEELGI
ncbi:hypothetical protein HBI38_178510 [Parastagonospora nodorum]|nr:hypothetical protein HBI09_081270 [Parastagonospora nodorum]KAH4183314.1 hypothetical protein HBH42_207640 [Parastagonospora nodorum]KAH4218014.1 hypothetical protein HBI06_206930 [Parastagonospora nodorum]KAH4242988.1 hypothetical protein HBI05_091970 [Parastagonospora nodorum]KAH4987890.1 hypothetical protein HBI76_088630 [Parastagonospora nodorum]